MKYLKETHMLDYSHPTIQKLIHDKQWKGMNEFNRIQSIYLNTHIPQVIVKIRNDSFNFFGIYV